MSTTYPQLTETLFPDAIDPMTRMSDITASDLAHVNQYYEYYNAGNMSAAAQVITAYNLDSKLFNAAKFNKLIDALVAVEKFFIEDAFNNRGAWNASVSYLPGDSVYDAEYGNGYVCRKANTNHRPLESASDEYWGLIALRGQRGPAGAEAVAYDQNPTMNGSAYAGAEDAWARGDHVHPTDTSRAAASHEHATSDITSGVLEVAHGGTNTSSAKGAETAPVYLASDGIKACTKVDVAHGGTGVNAPVGSGLRPVYLGQNGLVQCAHTLEKDVPADAKLTDTVALSAMTGVLAKEKGGTGATNPSDARLNLEITSGIVLPSSANDGAIFFLFEE